MSDWLFFMDPAIACEWLTLPPLPF